MPYLKYYLTKPSRNRNNMTKEQFAADLMKKFLDYHENYGKDGFLSERTDKEYFESKFPAYVEKQWNLRNDEVLQINSIAIADGDFITESQIECSAGFYRWI